MKNKTQQQQLVIKLRIEKVYFNSNGHFVVQLREDWKYLFFWGNLRVFFHFDEAKHYMDNYPESELAILKKENAKKQEHIRTITRTITYQNQSESGKLSLIKENNSYEYF